MGFLNIFVVFVSDVLIESCCLFNIAYFASFRVFYIYLLYARVQTMRMRLRNKTKYKRNAFFRSFSKIKNNWPDCNKVKIKTNLKMFMFKAIFVHLCSILLRLFDIQNQMTSHLFKIRRQLSFSLIFISFIYARLQQSTCESVYLQAYIFYVRLINSNKNERICVSCTME